MHLLEEENFWDGFHGSYLAGRQTYFCSEQLREGEKRKCWEKTTRGKNMQIKTKLLFLTPSKNLELEGVGYEFCITWNIKEMFKQV